MSYILNDLRYYYFSINIMISICNSIRKKKKKKKHKKSLYYQMNNYMSDYNNKCDQVINR